MNQPILVLDADQRAALAVTRALGRAGLTVLTGDSGPTSLAGVSRFAAGHLRYPSPYHEPDAFIAALGPLLERHRIGVLLPITDVTTALVLRRRAHLPPVALPFPDYATYTTLTDKQALYRRALALAVPVPETLCLDGPEAADPRRLAELTYPVVLKPSQSKVFHQGRWLSLGPRYAADPRELSGALADLPAGVPLLIQRRVVGEGRGLFALCDHGTPRVHFAHRRIRERPPSGGVSVLCESVPVDPELRRAADTLLADAGWHGVAMVEFKLDRDGRPYLIEVNGRFWGSLQLAIDAGLDFPLLLYHLALGQTPTAVAAYHTRRRSRWLLGDLDNLLLTLKAGERWRRRREIGGALLDFLRLWQPGTRFDVLRLSDPRPFLHELAAWLAPLYRR